MSNRKKENVVPTSKFSKFCSMVRRYMKGGASIDVLLASAASALAYFGWDLSLIHI